MRKPILFFYITNEQLTDLYGQLVEENYLVTHIEPENSSYKVIHTNIPISMQGRFLLWLLEDQKRSVILIDHFTLSSEELQQQALHETEEMGIITIACLPNGSFIDSKMKSQFVVTNELKIVMKMVNHYNSKPI